MPAHRRGPRELEPQHGAARRATSSQRSRSLSSNRDPIPPGPPPGTTNQNQTRAPTRQRPPRTKTPTESTAGTLGIAVPRLGGVKHAGTPGSAELQAQGGRPSRVKRARRSQSTSALGLNGIHGPMPAGVLTTNENGHPGRVLCAETSPHRFHRGLRPQDLEVGGIRGTTPGRPKPRRLNSIAPGHSNALPTAPPTNQVLTSLSYVVPPQSTRGIDPSSKRSQSTMIHPPSDLGGGPQINPPRPIQPLPVPSLGFHLHNKNKDVHQTRSQGTANREMVNDTPTSDHPVPITNSNDSSNQISKLPSRISTDRGDVDKSIPPKDGCSSITLQPLVSEALAALVPKTIDSDVEQTGGFNPTSVVQMINYCASANADPQAINTAIQTLMAVVNAQRGSVPSDKNQDIMNSITGQTATNPIAHRASTTIPLSAHTKKSLIPLTAMAESPRKLTDQPSEIALSRSVQLKVLGPCDDCRKHRSQSLRDMAERIRSQTAEEMIQWSKDTSFRDYWTGWLFEHIRRQDAAKRCDVTIGNLMPASAGLSYLDVNPSTMQLIMTIKLIPLFFNDFRMLSGAFVVGPLDPDTGHPIPNPAVDETTRRSHWIIVFRMLRGLIRTIIRHLAFPAMNEKGRKGRSILVPDSLEMKMQRMTQDAAQKTEKIERQKEADSIYMETIRKLQITTRNERREAIDLRNKSITALSCSDSQMESILQDFKSVEKLPATPLQVRQYCSILNAQFALQTEEANLLLDQLMTLDLRMKEVLQVETGALGFMGDSKSHARPEEYLDKENNARKTRDSVEIKLARILSQVDEDPHQPMHSRRSLLDL